MCKDFIFGHSWIIGHGPMHTRIDMDLCQSILIKKENAPLRKAVIGLRKCQRITVFEWNSKKGKDGVPSRLSLS